MRLPKLDVVPLRPAVRSDLPTTLDVLLTITPPPSETQVSRPPLNLGFVLDRSGSMGERNKITFARQAAAFAVRELRPTDRVSVTIFDERIETVFANAPATDPEAVVRILEQVQPRGSTALHGGWQEGGRQVKAHRQTEGLNRVLLLSDGLANVGEARPDVIGTDVHKLAREGVSTSTLGVGDDYNEDLLEAMARSGDGNYYYVESPAQLPHLFRTELHGLTATLGVDVSLLLEPRAGVVVADVLNEFDKTPDGRLKLPNLVGGQPVRVLVRLNVDAFTGERDLLRFRLDWHAPKDNIRQTATASLTLPAVPAAVWDGLAENAEVKEQAVLLTSARQKKEAARLADRGDYVGTRNMLAMNRAMLEASPASPALAFELAEQAEVEGDFDAEGDADKARFRKRAKHQAYRRHTSKPADETK
jgi:Ca-activated chloride channel family protein